MTYTKAQLRKATKARQQQSNSVNGRKHYQWVLDNLDTSPKALALANSYAKKLGYKDTDGNKATPVSKLTDTDAIAWLAQNIKASSKSEFNKKAFSHKRKPEHVRVYMSEYSKADYDKTGSNNMYRRVKAYQQQVSA